MEATLGETVYFQHEPLDQAQSAIRLVELLPDLHQGVIQCKITHSTISDSYNCLSYMWGDESQSRIILVNGRRFRVRKNLFNFLHLMQTHSLHCDASASPYFRRHYWIDAICIDQSNNSERNHQVAQMGRIFSSAQLVHIWLGNLPSAARMRYIPSISHKEMTLTDWLSTSYPYNYLMARHLFRNEYWTRAWVTQEIVLARAIIVSLGSEMMSLSELVHLLRDFAYDWNSKHNHFYQLAQRGQTADALRTRSLIFLLSYFRDKRCSVQRDRVFSLLSLCGDAHKIEVDYQARRVDLAVQILNLLPDAICVCSATVVASSLGLHADSAGVPKSALNSVQPWVDIHFSAVISEYANFSDQIAVWTHSLGHHRNYAAQHPCSRFVLALADWLLWVIRGTHKGLLQIVRERHTVSLSSALHEIGWKPNQLYSLDPTIPGYRMGIHDLDRNICVIRVALWALNPGSKFPQYPDLCYLHKPWRNGINHSIEKIEVVNDTKDESTYKDRSGQRAASSILGRQPGW